MVATLSKTEQAIVDLVSGASDQITLAGARTSSTAPANQVETHTWSGGNPYTEVLRAKDPAVAFNVAKMATKLCNNDNILYSQDYRYTAINELKKIGWRVHELTGGPYYIDCSALVSACIIACGIDMEICCTDSEVAIVTGTGHFTKVLGTVYCDNHAGLKVGDILRRKGHTEVVVGIGSNTVTSSKVNYSGVTGTQADATGSGNSYVDSSGGAAYSDDGSGVYNDASAGAGSAFTSAIGDWLSSLTMPSIAQFAVGFKTVTTTIQQDTIKHVDEDYDSSQGQSLVSYPTLVESPFVSLQVGSYTFGVFTEKDASGYVNFPNYITSMDVTKINGQVNQYHIELTYQISDGDDPNLVDRIFSTVGYGKVYISYGDWNAPTFVYKKEEAIITKVTSNVDFRSSCIKYEVYCTSSSLALSSGYFDFPKRTAKPSDIIQEMLSDSQYGLQELFPGNTSANVDKWLNLTTSDQQVEIKEQHGMDAMAYLNYLVTCMVPIGDDPDSVLKSGNYYLSISDDTYGETFNGTYFKVTYVPANGETGKIMSQSGVFEVDIGYPTDNMVTEFSIKNDNSWSLLYDYQSDENGIKNTYTYGITDDGKTAVFYSPALATSTKKNKMTEKQKTWWTQMTQFPIQAELQIKGLIRPTMLMSYLKVNAVFFGQKHVSSGLYVITKQKDNVGEGGYKTTLTLQRVAGDDDYIKTEEKQVTSQLVAGVSTEEVSSAFSSFVSSLASGLTGGISDVIDQISQGAASAASCTLGTTETTAAANGTSGGSEQVQTGSAPSASGPTSGSKYDSTTELAMRVAAAMATEQGFGEKEETLVALKWETSLLLNIFEQYEARFNSEISLIKQSGRKATITDFIFSGNWNENNRNAYNNGKQLANQAINLGGVCSFFASTAANAYMNVQQIGVSFKFSGTWSGTGVVTQKMVDAVKEVLNGKRYTNANEQGCDFGYLECNGTVIEGREAFQNAKKTRPDLFVPNVTKLQVVWADGSRGAKSTFVGFPNNNTKFDAFSLK